MLVFPFDPILRSHEVEQIVMQGDKRRYYRFRYAKFYNGITTADSIGCNLLCAYCWNYSRNLNPGKAGTFYSPNEVAERLKDISKKRDCDQFRVSGAEPFLGRASALHLVEVIKLVGGHFIIETNGIMLGYDPSLIDLLKPLDCLVRLTIKAHQGLDFEKITSANSLGFGYQIRAAEGLKKARIRLSIAVMAPFVDPSRLSVYADEVEDLIKYKSTERILRQRGLSLD